MKTEHHHAAAKHRAAEAARLKNLAAAHAEIVAIQGRIEADLHRRSMLEIFIAGGGATEPPAP